MSNDRKTIGQRDSFGSVARRITCGIAGLAVLAAAAATDGTWASATAGGNWSDTTKWVDGILPADGGVARFDFNGFDYTINATGVETTLGGFSLSNTTPRDKEVIFNGGTFNLVPPARIDQTHGAFNFRGTLVCEGDIVFNGGADESRFLLFGDQSLGGRIIISNMYVRIQNDGSLGPAPATLRPDAIILAGGALQNGQNFSSVSATRPSSLSLGSAGFLVLTAWRPL